MCQAVGIHETFVPFSSGLRLKTSSQDIWSDIIKVVFTVLVVGHAYVGNAGPGQRGGCPGERQAHGTTVGNSPRVLRRQPLSGDHVSFSSPPLQAEKRSGPEVRTTLAAR